MNKTVYLRDEEVPLWDRAKELSGDRLSPVIVEALREYVTRAEAEAKGYERIVVEFDDAEDMHLPKRKAFYGRWIIPPEDALVLKHPSGTFSAWVADTMKGNAVIVEKQPGVGSHKFRVFSSLQEASGSPEFGYAAREAIRRRGVPIEELDI